MDTDGLGPLLGYLASAETTDREGRPSVWTWQGWQLERITGGMNNRLFRATSGSADLAVKFTIRDERDRAGREWTALSLLSESDSALAPQPILLDRDSYPQPVVVQTWLDGDVSTKPPTRPAEWERLCDHLLAVHQKDVQEHHPGVRTVVLYVTSAEQALAAIRFQHGSLPEELWPASVNDLVCQVEDFPWPRWTTPEHRFCRADPNIRNFIRRSPGWASVDWEYSGWGDPAFEIADFLTHAAHIDWPAADRRHLAHLYCAGCDDPTLPTRLAVYEPLLLVWWTLRMGRYAHEVRAGKDNRLVTFSPDWAARRQTQQEQYLALAHKALKEFSA